jgi:hypothetical protein
MPVLTRRRNPDARQETWQVYYGDVRDSIAMRSGNPADTDPWGWNCGLTLDPIIPANIRAAPRPASDQAREGPAGKRCGCGRPDKAPH